MPKRLNTHISVMAVGPGKRAWWPPALFTLCSGTKSGWFLCAGWGGDKALVFHWFPPRWLQSLAAESHFLSCWSAAGLLGRFSTSTSTGPEGMEGITGKEDFTPQACWEPLLWAETLLWTLSSSGFPVPPFICRVRREYRLLGLLSKDVDLLALLVFVVWYSVFPLYLNRDPNRINPDRWELFWTGPRRRKKAWCSTAHFHKCLHAFGWSSLKTNVCSCSLPWSSSSTTTRVNLFFLKSNLVILGQKISQFWSLLQKQGRLLGLVPSCSHSHL